MNEEVTPADIPVLDGTLWTISRHPIRIVETLTSLDPNLGPRLGLIDTTSD